MPAPDLRLRASVKVEPVLEPTDDMPIEYLSEGEKKLTKRQRLLVWNAVNDPTLTFSEAAKKAGFNHFHYFAADIDRFGFPESKYDIVLFDASLHHVKKLDDTLSRVHRTLKPDGCLVINEYIGPDRFQWTKNQLKAANSALMTLPEKFRRITGVEHT